MTELAKARRQTVAQRAAIVDDLFMRKYWHANGPLRNLEHNFTNRGRIADFIQNTPLDVILTADMIFHYVADNPLLFVWNGAVQQRIDEAEQKAKEEEARQQREAQRKQELEKQNRVRPISRAEAAAQEQAFLREQAKKRAQELADRKARIEQARADAEAAKNAPAPSFPIEQLQGSELNPVAKRDLLLDWLRHPKTSKEKKDYAMTTYRPLINRTLELREE